MCLCGLSPRPLHSAAQSCVERRQKAVGNSFLSVQCRSLFLRHLRIKVVLCLAILGQSERAGAWVGSEVDTCS